MFKKLLLIILLLITFGYDKCNAQDWAPVGVQWYFSQSFFAQPGVTYVLIEATKDTTIQGKDCRKITGNFNPCTWSEMYSYKSNDSVYFYHPNLNKFCLLYDFSPTVGDTWNIENIGNGNDDTSKVYVDSIDQISISGNLLNVIYTHQTNTQESSFYFGGTIIENIGSIYSFSPSFSFCDPVPGNLRCYIDSNIYHHIGPHDCDYSTVNSPKYIATKIGIYPNPSSHFIRITLAETVSGNIEIINLAGQKVLYRTFEASSLKINTRKLAEGVYVLNIIDNNSIIHSEKLIIVR